MAIYAGNLSILDIFYPSRKSSIANFACTGILVYFQSLDHVRILPSPLANNDYCGKEQRFFLVNCLSLKENHQYRINGAFPWEKNTQTQPLSWPGKEANWNKNKKRKTKHLVQENQYTKWNKHILIRLLNVPPWAGAGPQIRFNFRDNILKAEVFMSENSSVTLPPNIVL